MKASKVKKLKIGDKIIVKFETLVIGNDNTEYCPIRIVVDEFGGGCTTWVGKDDIIKKTKPEK